MAELALVTLTPGGRQLAQRLLDAGIAGEIVRADGAGRQVLGDLFHAGRPLVCVMALGIVVRILGPLVRDKQSEPAVVVVDEAGKVAISVLGGHAAGANELTTRIAQVLGAIPVITTASDAIGLPAVDQIGRDWGWKIENPEQLKKVAAAVVTRRPIAVYQDAGRRDWWTPFGPWPATFHEVPWPIMGDWAAALIISDRAWLPQAEWPTVLIRPPTLVAGIGCRRGTTCAEIEALFGEVCQAQRLSPLSLGLVATATLKADEPGLLEFVDRHEVGLKTFMLDDLAQVADLPTPSARVKEKLGVWGVAEPAALLAAGTADLLVPKQRHPRVTLALARREDA